METPFDFLSVLLFCAVVATFFWRFQRENPPLAPYISICLLCAGANWFGNNAATPVAIALLILGTLGTIQLAKAPFGETHQP